MSEFKFACPVCGQHMVCDSSQGGSVMECPTCFQQIIAPQAPAPDAKFILTGTKVSEKKILVRGLGAATSPVARKNSFPAATLIGVIVLLLAGAGFYFFGGKFFHFSSAAWQTSDIGNVGTSGSFNKAGGLLTVNGSGADIWGHTDGFHYVFQTLDGDGSITAHVLNLKDTDAWAKTGVMIRETTNASSAFAFTGLRPDGQMRFFWRSATGKVAESSALVGEMGYPKWVKVVRSGNSFSAYYKVDAGSVWQPIGAPQTINMTANTLIGLAVCAHKAGTLCQAQFDQVTLQTGNDAGAK
jgi:hypothetical protein